MIKLAVPSKGRLQGATFDWFAARGITLKRSGQDREYIGSVSGFDGMSLVLMSASEIPRELAAGRVHLGVTGTDLIHEKLPLYEQQVTLLQNMGFGHADVVIAVPKFWVDVNSLDDLDAVAAQFRANHGFRLRIATKYHNIAREALRAFGVADYQLIDSQGATEGTIKNQTAEAICDITSTGATLGANHLKPLSDAPLLRSQAGLWRSETARFSPQDQDVLAALGARIG